MADRQHNPFANIDIMVPIEFQDEIKRYNEDRVSDDAPFNRQVDIWFLGLCVAVQLRLAPADLSNRKTYKMITGAIFASDPWRIQALTLIAMSRTDDIKIAAEPRRIMSMASELAAAGLPHVLLMLRDGDGDAIWNLSDNLEEILRKAA
jgi:hypothetical protein